MYEYEAVIVRVVDGDTIVADVSLGFGMWIHNETFRLSGINAPENSTVAGKEVSAYLKAILPAGTKVVLQTKKDKKEKFGRFLAVVLLNGEDLNLRLLSEGKAVKYL